MDVKWKKEDAQSSTGTSGDVALFLRRWPDDKEFSGSAEYVDPDMESMVAVVIPAFAGIRVGLAQDYVVKETKRQLEAMLKEFK